MVQVKLAKTKELVLDAVESALDSEDTELSEEMVWEDYCQKLHSDAVAAYCSLLWKHMEAMEPDAKYSIHVHTIPCFSWKGASNIWSPQYP